MPSRPQRQLKKVQARPCRRISLVVHPGAEPWAPSPEILNDLACRLTRDVRLELAPRSMLRQIWARDHGGRPLHIRDPYAFRAYSRDGQAVVFVDRTETPASALWVLLHEIAHLEVPASNMLETAFRNHPRRSDYLTSDEGHEAHPEEQLANFVATRTLIEMGLPSQQLDRLWWRKRVAANR